jgi:uncharacterized spore protein YtfJ
MANDNDFIKKLESLTFGFGAKAPVKKTKFKCPSCGGEHAGKVIGPIALPAPVAAAILAAAEEAVRPRHDSKDETAFSA